MTDPVVLGLALALASFALAVTIVAAWILVRDVYRSIRGRA